MFPYKGVWYPARHIKGKSKAAKGYYAQGRKNILDKGRAVG